MTLRDDRVRLLHALDAARRAVSSTEGWGRDRLNPEELPTLGLIRLLEVLGEATSHVSSELQDAHPEVPWKAMKGLRNRLSHGYFEVNLDIVWETLRSDLPQLILALESVLFELDREHP